MSRCTRPLLVGVVQRFGHGRHQFHGFVGTAAGTASAFGKVGAVDVLRDDEAGELLGAADIVDGNDVRMVQVGDGAGLDQIGFGVFGRETSWACGTLMATSRCNWSSWAR